MAITRTAQRGLLADAKRDVSAAQNAMAAAGRSRRIGDPVGEAAWSNQVRIRVENAMRALGNLHFELTEEG